MDEKNNTQQEQADELTRKMQQWRRANPKATLTEIEEAVEVFAETNSGRVVQEERALPEKPDFSQKRADSD